MPTQELTTTLPPYDDMRARLNSVNDHCAWEPLYARLLVHAGGAVTASELVHLLWIAFGDNADILSESSFDPTGTFRRIILVLVEDPLVRQEALRHNADNK